MIRGGNDVPTFYYIIGSFGGCRTILKCVGWRRSQQYPDQAAPIARWCLALFCQVPLALSTSSHFTGQTSHLTGTTATAASSHMLRALCKPSSESKVMSDFAAFARWRGDSKLWKPLLTQFCFAEAHRNGSCNESKTDMLAGAAIG